jgi:hypothetical protein
MPAEPPANGIEIPRWRLSHAPDFHPTSSYMGAVPRERDFEAERHERNSFIVLQHVYTITTERPGFPPHRIADDLALARGEAAEIIGHLIDIGFLERLPGSLAIRLTPQGSDYIERLAWRRRSVRI